MSQKWNRRFAAIGIMVPTIMFVAIVCWLHVVRPDLDPSRTGISRYAAGDYGHAVTAGFALLSLAILVAAAQFAGAFSRALAIAAAGLLLVVFFPLRSSSPGRLEYMLHQLGGAVFFAAGAFGVQAISRKLSASSAPAALRATARVSTVIAAIAVVAFVASVVGRGSWLNASLGMFQRISFAAICIALATLGLDLLREPRVNSDLRGRRP